MAVSVTVSVGLGGLVWYVWTTHQEIMVVTLDSADRFCFVAGIDRLRGDPMPSPAGIEQAQRRCDAARLH